MTGIGVCVRIDRQHETPSMFDVDHIAVWLRDRDAALSALSVATGLPILDGYAPEGRRVARGVRFGNGPFVDLHQVDQAGQAFLGLSGDVRAAEALARQAGWKARLAPHRMGEDPWAILSFAPGQGLLSRLFVIQYAADAAAWTSPVFNGGLYHRPAAGGPALRRVRLAASDPDDAGRVLQTLGFGDASDGRFRAASVELVIAQGEDGVVGVDVAGDTAANRIALGPEVTAVVGGCSTHRG